MLSKHVRATRIRRGGSFILLLILLREANHALVGNLSHNNVIRTRDPFQRILRRDLLTYSQLMSTITMNRYVFSRIRSPTIFHFCLFSTRIICMWTRIFTNSYEDAYRHSICQGTNSAIAMWIQCLPCSILPFIKVSDLRILSFGTSKDQRSFLSFVMWNRSNGNRVGTQYVRVCPGKGTIMFPRIFPIRKASGLQNNMVPIY